MKSCPICGGSLADNEELVAYFYKPQSWWVVSHISLSAIEGEVFYQNGIPRPGHLICSRAGFTVSLISDSGPG